MEGLFVLAVAVSPAAWGDKKSECIPLLVAAASDLPVESSPAASQAAFDAIFDRVGIAPESALARAEAIEVWLANLLRAGTDDRAVAAALLALQSSRECSELGHPLRRDPPPLGPWTPSSWITEKQELEDVWNTLAAQSKLLPGSLREPILLQFVDRPETAGLPSVHRAEPGDGNVAALYRGQVLLFVEEYLHLVQRLRSYGRARGTAVNVSHWARRSDATYVVDYEADVYAWLLEQWGTAVPPSWRTRYASRAYVPAQ